METDVLKNFDEKIDNLLDYISTGPINMCIDDENNINTEPILTNTAQIIENDDDDDEDAVEPVAKRTKGVARAKKIDPQLLIEGKILILFDFNRLRLLFYCFFSF